MIDRPSSSVLIARLRSHRSSDASFIAGAILLFIAVCQMVLGGVSSLPRDGQRQDSTIQVPDDMKFEPHWRSMGDCGPISLYLLMRLSGRSASLRDVKDKLPVDPVVGCSLADIARAANSLDFDVECRFVTPESVPSLPVPFILHANGSLQRRIAHFAVIVGQSPGRRIYSVIDTTFGGVHRRTEESLLSGYSGYVLLHKSPMHDKTPFVCAAFLVIAICLTAIAASSHYTLEKRWGKPGHP